MSSPPHPYVELVAARAVEPARSWFLERIAKLDAGSFAVAHAGSGRRLGAQGCQLTSAERRRLEGEELWLPELWPLSAVGRAALAVELCARLAPRDSEQALVSQFRTGDNAEREAILRSLWLLPHAGRFVELAIDACRSHVQSVFEAIACENPYPAAFFPEHNFNQLVLKAFFTGVQVKRIVDLSVRRTPELARMARAYASERRAAGRSVPDDLGLATGASE
jgi:hypothetical protein